ncbi:MAG: zf-HC2 domain-containing protein [Candidatus Omnitrophica bacterium]|nr:zf-HC2 domain-containing protein [Candidatus Omnitrophota bacterium]
MNCEQVRELLFADYIDGELKGGLRLEAEDHLRACSACRELAAQVAAGAKQPFESVRKEEAPAYLWERVRARVLSDKRTICGVKAGILEAAGRIAANMAGIPRSALAFAAACAVLIAFMLARPIAQTRAADEYLGEQMEFLISLTAAEPNGAEFFDTEICAGNDKTL